MSQVTQDSRIQRARAHHRHRDEALPSFYGLLQLSVRDLKQLRSAAGCARCRATVDAALLMRASLIVASAVAFISLMGALFGAQSAIPAVALYVCILCVRFVGFNYAPIENLKAMAVVFAVLTMMPLLGQHADALARLVLNIAGLMIVMVVAVDDPRMGNGGTYGFAYALLAGAVYDAPLRDDEMPLRVATMAAGFLLCAAVYWRCRNRTAEAQRARAAGGSFAHRTIGSALREVSLDNEKTRYHLRAALGISLAFFVGDVLGMRRLMWMGLVGSSLLTPHATAVRDRIWWRLGFSALGVVLFCIVYPAAPPLLQAVFGMVIGMCCGLSGKYHWTQAFNTMGAMLLGQTMFGMGGAAFWRIADSLLAGAVVAAFSFAYRRGLSRLGVAGGEA